MNKAILILAVLLAACTPHHRHHAVQPAHVKVIKTHIGAASNDDWLYWYILTQQNQTYYYSSSSPISNYTTVQFTRVSGSLPPQVQEAEKEGQVVEEQTLAPEQEPANVEADQMADTNPSDSSPSSNDGVSDSNASDSGSADSGSSGGDSGGGGGE